MLGLYFGMAGLIMVAIIGLAAGLLLGDKDTVIKT
jgi:hypothetical protein